MNNYTTEVTVKHFIRVQKAFLFVLLLSITEITLFWILESTQGLPTETINYLRDVGDTFTLVFVITVVSCLTWLVFVLVKDTRRKKKTK